MPPMIRRYATPLTTGLFAVSAISGVALFFHWAQGSFHEMHEWLSMVLLVPFALHLWRNWSSLLGYFRRAPMTIALVLSLVVAIPFAVGGAKGGGGGGNPAFRLMPFATQAPLSELAPVLKTTPAELVSKLKAGGYTAAAPDRSIDAIARSSGAEPIALLSLVLPSDAKGN